MGASAPRGSNNPYPFPVQTVGPVPRLRLSGGQGITESHEPDSGNECRGKARFSPRSFSFASVREASGLSGMVLLMSLASRRERNCMTTQETAKPCPSKECKKPKVQILLEVLKWAGRLYKFFNLVDSCWRWLKGHWQVIKDWLDGLL